MLSDIFSNHLLMNALLAWATAQLLKFFIYLAVNRTIDWKRLTGDGGMPSGHSATVTALAVTSGLEYGYDSPVFAVCVILAVIVMHDAMGVRREAGRHAKAINELLEMLDSLDGTGASGGRAEVAALADFIRGHLTEALGMEDFQRVASLG